MSTNALTGLPCTLTIQVSSSSSLSREATCDFFLFPSQPFLAMRGGGEILSSSLSFFPGQRLFSCSDFLHRQHSREAQLTEKWPTRPHAQQNFFFYSCLKGRAVSWLPIWTIISHVAWHSALPAPPSCTVGRKMTNLPACPTSSILCSQRAILIPTSSGWPLFHFPGSLTCYRRGLPV